MGVDWGMKCDFLQTRILSVFNLLKRVGFVVLLLGANVFAQEIDTLWTRTYFPCDGSDAINAVAPFSLGGVAVGGSHSGGSRAYIQHVDENQSLVWTQESFGPGLSLISDLVTEIDGSIIFAAISPSDIFGGIIGKLNSTGDTIWINRNEDYGGYGFGRSLCRGVDSGHVLLSHAFQTRPSGPEILVQHVDTSGTNIWSRTIDISDMDDAWDITPFMNGYVFVGTTASFDNEDTSYTSVVKLAANGDSCWTVLLERGYDDNTQAAVATLGDSLIVVAGHRWDDLGSFHRTVFITLLDSLGAVAWTWYSHANVDNLIRELHVLSNGDILVVGTRYSPLSGPDGLLFCIRPFEGLQWEITADAGYEEFFTSAAVLADDHFIAGGRTNSWPNCHQNYDDWLVGFGRLSPTNYPPQVITTFSLSVHPNPFNNTTEISFDVPRTSLATLKVYDLLGREVAVLLDEIVGSGVRTVVWNASGFSSGIYFLRLAVGRVFETRKVVLLR